MTGSPFMTRPPRRQRDVDRLADLERCRRAERLRLDAEDQLVADVLASRSPAA